MSEYLNYVICGIAAAVIFYFVSSYCFDRQRYLEAFKNYLSSPVFFRPVELEPYPHYDADWSEWKSFLEKRIFAEKKVLILSDIHQRISQLSISKAIFFFMFVPPLISFSLGVEIFYSVSIALGCIIGCGFARLKPFSYVDRNTEMSMNFLTGNLSGKLDSLEILNSYKSASEWIEKSVILANASIAAACYFGVILSGFLFAFPFLLK